MLRGLREVIDGLQGATRDENSRSGSKEDTDQPNEREGDSETREGGVDFSEWSRHLNETERIGDEGDHPHVDAVDGLV